MLLSVEQRRVGIVSELDKMKAQVESLKCCGNCVHFMWGRGVNWKIPYCSYRHVPFPWDPACQHWEKKEVEL